MQNASHKPAVLLTGFGPFPGVPVNASAALVAELGLRARHAWPDVLITAECLPSEWAGAIHRLNDLLESFSPDVVLHFGVSNDAAGLVVETLARNATCAVADAAGALPQRHCLAEDGADALRVTFDVPAIRERLRRLGLAASLSDDAGDYLCNAVLYHSLFFSRQHKPDMRAGFIHIPDRLHSDHLHTAHRQRGTKAGADSGPRQSRRPAVGSSLKWQEAISASLEILAVCLEGKEGSRE